MTKAQELEILEKAISQLGEDSYLGPWLSQVKGEVESSIRSDIFPDILPSQTAKKCDEILKVAQDLVQNTLKQRESIVNSTREKINQIVEKTASEMRASLKRLENI